MKLRHLSITLLALIVTASTAMAELQTSRMFSDNMVLQCDRDVPVWGWADKEATITVEFGGQKVTATADDDGKWKAVLKPMKANAESQVLTVTSSADKRKLEFKNVLVGEVWHCSGQSNMEQGLGMVDNSRSEIANADFANIRLFLLNKQKSDVSPKDIIANWKPCSPSTVTQGGWGGGFSGVAYFFGRKLHRELGVPVGLIQSAWGGTPIELWTPPAGLESVPALPNVPEKEPFLYNRMIQPLVPYAIRGVIWYQGEANMGDDMIYHEKMKALIAGWRHVWKQDKPFPFYFAQLAPYSWYPRDALPKIWEAQTATLSVPNTGMTVTTDITGNMGDIHPKNKQDVGRRLALWALARTYQRKNLVYSGPLYESMRIEGDKIRLAFAHTGSGLKSRDGKPLTQFSIAGKTGPYIQATAVIEGRTVVVHSPRIAAPARVSFGWSNTANPNLCNNEGLPAAPFRTDGWHGATGMPKRPTVVLAGKPFTVRNLCFHPRIRDAKWQGQLFYRTAGSKKFTGVPVRTNADSQLEATIPGEALKKPLEYFVEFREQGRVPISEPHGGADAPLTLLPDFEAPSGVTGLKAAEVNDFRVALDWQPASDDSQVIGYRVYRGARSGFETTDDNALMSEASPLLTCVDEAPPVGKSVWYAVRAIDSVARTGPPVYLKADVPANRPPENHLKLKAVAAGKWAFLRWSGAFDPDVVAFEILRGEGNEGELELLAEIKDVTATHFLDTNVETETDYRYAIRLRDRSNLRSPAGAPQSVRPGLVLKRINCGGPELVLEDGVPWEADQGKGHANLKSSATRVWTVPGAVKKTGPYQNVYQTERWAQRQVRYTFKLDPGRYEVLLLFAETNRGFFAKGKRTFDIVLGDEVVAAKADVFAASGPMTGWEFRKTVDVAGGELKVGVVGNPTGPAIKGIEIRGLRAK